MSPKVGRPKAENPKVFRVVIRLDEKTNTDLLRYAEQRNITKTEALRRAILMLLEEEK